MATFAQDRPAVYRMINPVGRVIYVGKSKELRTRLLSYFRASFPYDKAARIITATCEIEWDYQPSDFSAHLTELRQIKKHKPLYNVRMNRTRTWVLVKVSSGPAPKIYIGRSPGPGKVRHYGPFRSPGRVRDAVKTLNDLLGLRDCALNMPIVYSEQVDLFGLNSRAGCIRYELKTCTAPCAGFVTEAAYTIQVAAALAFLEGRSITPIDRVVETMSRASDSGQFEIAARWRARFESLEWFFAEINKARSVIDSLTFVYTDPGSHGEAMSYVINRARVRAAAPAPRTPIEAEAFRALVAQHGKTESSAGPVPADDIDEMLLLLSWFRRHPAAIRKTVPLEYWVSNGHRALHSPPINSC